MNLGTIRIWVHRIKFIKASNLLFVIIYAKYMKTCVTFTFVSTLKKKRHRTLTYYLLPIKLGNFIDSNQGFLLKEALTFRFKGNIFLANSYLYLWDIVSYNDTENNSILRAWLSSCGKGIEAEIW